MAFLAYVPLAFGSNRPFFWSLNAAILGLLAVGYGANALIKKRNLAISLWTFGAAGVLFIAYLLALVLQILPSPTTLSVAPGSTFFALLRAGSYGIFFVIIFEVARSRANRHLLLDLMLATNALHALLGLVSLRAGDVILGAEKWAYLGSATGSFLNRNSFATFLAFGAALGIGLTIDTIRSIQVHRDAGLPWSRIAFLLISVAIIMAALVATESRMGLLAGLVGIIVVLGCSARQIRFNLTSIVVMGAILLSGAGLALLNLDGVLDRFLTAEASLGVRLELFEQSLQLIMQRPLTGFGGGTFEVAFPLVHQSPVDVDLVWDKPHNTYLSMWAGLGFVAGSFPMAALALLGLAILRQSDGRSGSAGAIALGVLATGAVHSLVDFSLEIQAVMFWFLGLVAIGFARTKAAAANSAPAGTSGS